MQYFLYKLKFPYGVHFGADKAGIYLEKISVNCHCDTLYSAICHEILKLYGEEALKSFYEETKSGKFLLSDLLPYKQDNLLIPKPILYIERNVEKQVSDSVKKKKMKKLQFIPVMKINEFFNGEAEEIEFAKNVVYEKNAISKDSDSENNKLYSVAITRFDEDCGLYFIVKMQEDKKEWFDGIINSLALSGIGGKRTSGYGQFEVEDDCQLEINSNISEEAKIAQLLEQKGDYYLTLSAFYPQKEEILKLKSGYYSLIQRQGFVQSATYSDNLLKKIPITMINAGSCFEERFDGDITDVSKQGNHPVYRYGKPIMIGINV